MITRYDLSRRATVSAVVGVLVLSLGCGGDGDGDSNPAAPAETPQSVFPASWGGEWDIVMSATDCDTGTLAATSSDTGLICPGESADFVGAIATTGGTFTLTCDATISETKFELTCSGPGRIADRDCDLDLELAGTRDGDHFTWTGEMNVAMHIPDWPDPVNACIAIAVNGTRTSTDTAGCPGNAPELSLQSDLVASLLL